MKAFSMLVILKLVKLKNHLSNSILKFMQYNQPLSLSKMGDVYCFMLACLHQLIKILNLKGPDCFFRGCPLKMGPFFRRVPH